MVANLAELILDAARRAPDARIGLADTPWRLADVVALASRFAELVVAAGVDPGATAALLGENSVDLIATWMGLHLAGVEVASINHNYPGDLREAMLDDLGPDVVVTTDAGGAAVGGRTHIDASEITAGRVLIDGAPSTMPPASGTPPGLHRKRLDIAGYMHTSGTTGPPKFCAQSHEYFLRLGRFFSDTLAVTDRDTVLAPLPLFHINPLGYGLVGSLVAGASMLTVRRFSARSFWTTVNDGGVTVLVLHAPPIEILKRSASQGEAATHNVRAMFFADLDFMRMFGIPLGMSCYGSTEVGGLSHGHIWRVGDDDPAGTPASRYAGRARGDIEWRLDTEGQIMIRATEEGVLFSGYRVGGVIRQPCDDDGWFATGDIGRVGNGGDLIFVERRADSIRVKGEYVPIEFVEQAFAAIEGVEDVAVTSRPDGLVDEQLVLYVASSAPLDVAAIREVCEALPVFMRPRQVVRVSTIPRDLGVGKVLRRRLPEVDACEALDL